MLKDEYINIKYIGNSAQASAIWHRTGHCPSVLTILVYITVNAIDLLCPDGYTFRQGNKPCHLKSRLYELCILDNMSNVVWRKPVYAERGQN